MALLSLWWWLLVMVMMVMTTMVALVRSADGTSGQTTEQPDYNQPINASQWVQWEEEREYFSDEQELMHALVGHYENSVRPVFNASDPVDVKLGLTLTQILDLDEKNQVLTTNVWLEAEWFDQRLGWNSSEFGGITSIRIPCERLWLPDIVLYNSVDDYTSGYMPSLAMVYNDSRVFWGPVIRFRSSCKIDITYFPFDDQVCSLKLGSWAYNGFQVNVWNRSATMDLSNLVDNGEWELVAVKVERNVVWYNCCDEPFPDVTFFVHLRRRVKYYFMNIIIPCIILSFLCLAGFLLPPESGEKITLGLSVLLTITVFMLMVADKMPQTSESISVISIYLMVVLATSCLSVLSSVWVLSIHHQRGKPRPVPSWLRFIVFSIIARVICVSTSTSYRRSSRTSSKGKRHRKVHKSPRRGRVATEEKEYFRMEQRRPKNDSTTPTTQPLLPAPQDNSLPREGGWCETEDSINPRPPSPLHPKYHQLNLRESKSCSVCGGNGAVTYPARPQVSPCVGWNRRVEDGKVFQGHTVHFNNKNPNNEENNCNLYSNMTCESVRKITEADTVPSNPDSAKDTPNEHKLPVHVSESENSRNMNLAENIGQYPQQATNKNRQKGNTSSPRSNSNEDYLSVNKKGHSQINSPQNQTVRNASKFQDVENPQEKSLSHPELEYHSSPRGVKTENTEEQIWQKMDVNEGLYQENLQFNSSTIPNPSNTLPSTNQGRVNTDNAAERTIHTTTQTDLDHDCHCCQCRRTATSTSPVTTTTISATTTTSATLGRQSDADYQFQPCQYQHAASMTTPGEATAAPASSGRQPDVNYQCQSCQCRHAPRLGPRSQAGALVERLMSVVQARHGQEAGEEALYRQWHDVACVLDRLLFYLFLLITLVSSAVILQMRPTHVHF